MSRQHSCAGAPSDTRILVTYGVRRNGWYRGPGSLSGPPLARERQRETLGTTSEGSPTLCLKVIIHTVKKGGMWKVRGICSHFPYLIRQKTDFSWVKSLKAEPGTDQEGGEHSPLIPSLGGEPSKENGRSLGPSQQELPGTAHPSPQALGDLTC